MFLRMLSYYIGWHMKQALAPILFADNDKPAAAAKRTNPVAAAQRSDKALTKAARKRTTTRCTASRACSPTWPPSAPTTSSPPTNCQLFTKMTTPTPLQRRAFQLLDVSHRHGST